MNFLKKIVLFAFISTLFVTCKKEVLTPSSTVGQPVFSFIGTIGSTPINWQAGVNNYYMYSSYSQSSGVYSFMGNLQSTASINNSIQISINDYRVVSSGAQETNISDSSLAPSSYLFNIPGGNPISYSVFFKPIIDTYTTAPHKYAYTFGDGSNIDSVNSSPGTVTHIYKHPGNYSTSISGSFSNSKDSFKTTSLSNILYLGTPDSRLSFYAVTVGQGVGINNLNFTPVISGSPTSFSYSFGDGKHLTTSNSLVSHTYPDSGMYSLSVTAYDAMGDTVTYNENILTPYYYNRRTLNYATSATPIANPLLLSNVTILYTDGQGNQYTSNNASQPSGSSFRITSVSPYAKTNLNGDPTMQLNIAFSCILYNGTQDIPASGTAVIAVAYH